MIKKSTLTCCLLFAALITQAQRSPWWNIYRQNWQLINPAAVDRWHFMTRKPDYNWLLSSGGHLQWVGLEGAPVTGFLSAEAVPVNRFDNVRWGTRLLFDQTDAFTTWGLSGNFTYSVQLPNSKGYTLYLAAQPQVSSFTVNRSRLVLENPDDAIVNFYHYDQWQFDAGFGAFLRARRDWYVGVSTPSLAGLSQHPTDQQPILNRAPQVDVMGGFYQKMGEGIADEAFFEYNLWLRYLWATKFLTTRAALPLSADATVRFYKPEHYWLGAGLGTNGTASVEVGFVRLFEDPKFTYNVHPNICRIGLSVNWPVWYSSIRLGSGIGAELTATYGFSDWKN